MGRPPGRVTRPGAPLTVPENASEEPSLTALPYWLTAPTWMMPLFWSSGMLPAPTLTTPKTALRSSGSVASMTAGPLGGVPICWAVAAPLDARLAKFGSVRTEPSMICPLPTEMTSVGAAFAAGAATRPIAKADTAVTPTAVGHSLLLLFKYFPLANAAGQGCSAAETVGANAPRCKITRGMGPGPRGYPKGLTGVLVL
ncbi:hypothetical protein PJL18_04275 [Paenarthrobacter nicotinovorans]|nr:hypothetical protein [Paenarthrobacter nicotinovorans]